MPGGFELFFTSISMMAIIVGKFELSLKSGLKY
jgi:hypothetical protein